MARRMSLRRRETDNDELTPRRFRWSREPNIENTARRYLGEGRVRVLFVDRTRVFARCEGRYGVYHTGYEPGQAWWCTCGMWEDCHHRQAVRLVTRPLPPFSNVSLGRGALRVVTSGRATRSSPPSSGSAVNLTKPGARGPSEPA